MAHDRPDALRGEAAGEGDGVSLGDADVEEALRPLLLEDVGAGARRHGRGDRHQIRDARRRAPVSASPKTWVQVGGPLAFLRGSPVSGS